MSSEEATTNEIELRNLTSEEPPAEHLNHPRLKRFWGWFMFSEIVLKKEG